MEITGIIEKITKGTQQTKFGLKDKYTITMAGNTYSDFGLTTMQEGQNVKINYTVNGKFNNIDNVVILDMASNTTNVSPAPASIQAPPNTLPRSRDKLILKQVALKASVELHKAKKELDLKILCSDAEVLYDWLLGEND